MSTPEHKANQAAKEAFERETAAAWASPAGPFHAQPALDPSLVGNMPSRLSAGHGRPAVATAGVLIDKHWALLSQADRLRAQQIATRGLMKHVKQSLTGEPV